ncbi:MAG TPA: LysE family transporter [Candidatus Kapabacteria bacterium]|nr:LysE family transporter [Candidatus Kapabacteria bacterium]HPU23227.1 LysE family transporter [Candidatus Kapabacteria bacterium]
MIAALLIGLIVGFILALPPGPIGVLSIKMGLNRKIRPAMYVAIGSGVADFMICFVAITAATAVVQALHSFFDCHPIYSILFQSILIAAFLFYGLYSLKSKPHQEKHIEDADLENQNNFVRHFKEKGPFLLGFALAIANLANPTFLPSIGYVGVQVQKFALYEITTFNNLLYSIGFSIGNFVWLYTLSNIVFRLKNKFSDNLIVRVKQFAGITFISFGGILGWRLLFFTKWSEVLRLVVASI